MADPILNKMKPSFPIPMKSSRSCKNVLETNIFKSAFLNSEKNVGVPLEAA